MTPERREFLELAESMTCCEKPHRYELVYMKVIACAACGLKWFAVDDDHDPLAGWTGITADLATTPAPK